MLYSILPPILIVLSLIGIIVMLVRKSSKLAEVIEAEAQRDQSAGLSAEKIGIRKKAFRTLRKFPFKKIILFFLNILKSIANFFLAGFIKSGTIYKNWRTNAREKRRLRQAGKLEQVQNENDEADEILEKIREYNLDVKKTKIDVPEVEIAKSVKNTELEMEEYVKETREEIQVSDGQKIEEVITVVDEERVVRPMVSDKVVSPQPRAEIRDRLEELLIERIAANPKDIEAYERLGEYYMEIKSYEFAKECFKQVIKLDPLNRNVKYKMRRLEHLLSR